MYLQGLVHPLMKACIMFQSGMGFLRGTVNFFTRGLSLKLF